MKDILATVAINLIIGLLISIGVYQVVQWIFLLTFLVHLASLGVWFGAMLASVVFGIFLILWLGSFEEHTHHCG